MTPDAKYYVSLANDYRKDISLIVPDFDDWLLAGTSEVFHRRSANKLTRITRCVPAKTFIGPQAH